MCDAVFSGGWYVLGIWLSGEKCHLLEVGGDYFLLEGNCTPLFFFFRIEIDGGASPSVTCIWRAPLFLPPVPLLASAGWAFFFLFFFSFPISLADGIAPALQSLSLFLRRRSSAVLIMNILDRR